MLADRNRHVVIPGRVYRSAQLEPDELEQVVREKNIKTIVNLRGRPAADWYPAEAKATQALGISQEDVTLSANRLPPTDEIRRLVDVLDHSEYPILLHCRQGADRTSLASTAYLLLHTDVDYSTAMQHCSLRFGHAALHTAACIDEFFDLYVQWLKSNGVEHSSARFRHWATKEYCPGAGRADLTWIQAPPAIIEVGKPIVFKVRATNTSRKPWNFTAGTRFGIHAAYIIADSQNAEAYSGKAGFIDATVAPGEHIDLEIPVPATMKAGRYQITVDLAERGASFTQYGSEPLTHDWEARDPTPLRSR
jgi:protein tyrosine phosphatase (PTP) superfamily phosphohydrolase (DUF442 family)